MKIIKGLLNFIMDTMETIVFMGTLYIVVYLYLFQPSAVQGASMQPNLETGDRLITSKVTYKLRPVERGDIVVVKSPVNPEISLIKRVIGLPGETIMIKNGLVYVNGEVLPHEYTSSETHSFGGDFLPEDTIYTIPQERYFVMGDNRSRSMDSRSFGPVAISNIEGQAIFRYFPPYKQEWFSNPFEEELRH